VIIATAGHVDHGKTSLVRQLTGVDTDRLSEEKARGLTIDLGFAYTQTNDATLGFIDVPGHIRFIHNMLAGVSVVDLALLVIAADDGPMPQTTEHLTILDLLGISRAITVITKIDRVSADRVASVESEVKTALAATSLASGPIVAASSETGEGIPALRQLLVDAASETTERHQDGYFRLAIDRSFNVKGSGTVVTGSVFDGSAQVGDQLRLMPSGATVRVRGLHRQNEQAQATVAGDRCALNLSGNVSPEDIHRGDWITNSPLPSTRRIDAQLSVPASLKALRHGRPVHFHCAAMHSVGRVAILTDKQIKPGQQALAQITLSEPLCVYPGDRLILRDQAAENTLAGGTVIDPFPPARGRSRPARINWLSALIGPSLEQSIDQSIEQSTYPSENALLNLLDLSPTGVDIEAYAQSRNYTADALEWQLAAVQVTTESELIGQRLVTTRQLTEWGAQTIEALSAWHRANPDTPGLSASGLREMLDTSIPKPVKDHVIGRLLKDTTLSNQGGRYALSGRQAQLKPADQVLWEQIREVLADDPLRPPVLSDLAKSLSNSPVILAGLLKRCIQLGYVVQPTSNRYYLQTGIDQLINIVQALAGEKEGFTVREFRDSSGLGRNLCIELLEYFDSQGLTIRDGDKRRVARL